MVEKRIPLRFLGSLGKPLPLRDRAQPAIPCFSGNRFIGNHGGWQWSQGSDKGKVADLLARGAGRAFYGLHDPALCAGLFRKSE